MNCMFMYIGIDYVRRERVEDIHKGTCCAQEPWSIWHIRMDCTEQLRYMGVPQFAEHTKTDGTKRLTIKLMIVEVSCSSGCSWLCICAVTLVMVDCMWVYRLSGTKS